MLRENLLTIFERLKEKDPSLTPYRIAMESILDPASLKKGLDGKIRFSDMMLEKIASHPEMGVTLIELKAWRLMDEYSEAEIRQAGEVIRARYNSEKPRPE